MNDQRPTIAVCGATGQQGGAVLRHLEAQDRWNLRALSRNPDGDAARRIRERGIEVVRADLVDGDSLRAAFNGAAGVYGVTTPMSAKGKLDVELEMRQGRAIVDACADTGVGHLVLSTVLHIDDNVTVPYLKTKREIERYVIERGIPHTFLCPACAPLESPSRTRPPFWDVSMGTFTRRQRTRRPRGPLFSFPLSGKIKKVPIPNLGARA
jgi:uncharacterized protein YbjT (DUF2867 family)